MIRRRINKNYISEADSFLHLIKQQSGLSNAQHTEQMKHQHIAQQRDHVNRPIQKTLNTLWKDF